MNNKNSNFEMFGCEIFEKNDFFQSEMMLLMKTSLNCSTALKTNIIFFLNKVNQSI